MKALLKLLVVAAIVNATARVAMATWQHYEFKDAAEQLLLFGGNATLAELHDRIAQRAVDLEIPIDPDGIDVTTDGTRTLARASYTRPVELFPRYVYPLNFSFEVDTLALNASRTRDLEQRAR